jgi:hypothetical protein
MEELAASVMQESTRDVAQVSCEVDSEVLENPRYGEYARNIVSRYTELQVVLSGLEATR